ncbi:MAG: AmmeMemoRadiSam system protein A [Pseudomonadota bacterium]
MPYDFVLADDEKHELLRIARATLKEFLTSGRTPPGAPHRKSLTAPAAVFVSLHAGDSLRGCIGTIAEDAPLYKAVQQMAVAAATRDPRFQPVSLKELSLLTVEVSVLGERCPLSSPEQIEIGKHGLILTAFGRRGLLLPQVAVEHGWSPLVFLEKTCEKAGLPEASWQDPNAVVEVFSAQVFSESSSR